MPGKKTSSNQQTLPSREEILAFLTEQSGKAGKREIARAFGITGGGKIALKRLLREMSDDGLIEKRRKRLNTAGELPGVTVLLVTGRDEDGELLAEPDTWDTDAHGDPPLVLLAPPSKKQRGQTAGIGDRVLTRISGPPDGSSAQYSGSVIKVLDRRPAEMLGVFKKTPFGGRIEPVSRKQRELEIGESDAEGLRDGDLVLAELRKSARKGPPRARIRERIGSMKSEKAVSMIAIHEHRLPFRFPQAALDEAEAAKPITEKAREDWRSIPFITIDPADAKDHDDAVHAETDPDNPGGFIVHVAIADVAHYIRPGSEMDREAQRRGNSAYFPDRVVPMLPERISNDLCSLRAGENRPALAVRMLFDETGRKTGHSFHRILMRSAEKLSYNQAQSAIDGNPDQTAQPLVKDVLRPLWDAYACLERGRQAREPLELDLPERRIKLTKDGHVEEIYIPPRLDAHRLIEEFMIQANVAAAESLEKKRSPLIYRIHDVPSPEKIEALREFLKTLDMSVSKSGTLRPSHFNRILRQAAETDKSHLVNQVVLRSQAQAEYNADNIGHFGLNLRRYAHFTSPIRRYADLIVHRALIKALDLGEGGLPDGFEGKLDVIAAEISATERRAMVAERQTVDRLMAHWLSERIGASFRGRIAGVTRAGLFVELDESGADGFVPMSSLGSDYFYHDEANHALRGEKTGETHRLGDRVEVRLLEAAPLAGALRFELLSEGKREKPQGRRPMRRSRNTSRGRKRR